MWGGGGESIPGYLRKHTVFFIFQGVTTPSPQPPLGRHMDKMAKDVFLKEIPSIIS